MVTVLLVRNNVNLSVLKNELGDLHLYLIVIDKHDKMQLFAKFQKKIIWSWLRATLNFQNFIAA